MNVHKLKKIIWAGVAIIFLMGIAAIVTGLALPVKVTVDETIVRKAALKMKPAGAKNIASVKTDNSAQLSAELRRLCGIELRRPLLDVVKANAGVDAPSAPPSTLSIRLVGTINEPGHSMAIFQKSDGATVVCAQGQSIDDSCGKIAVREVSHQKAQIVHAGKTYELVIPKEQTAQVQVSPHRPGRQRRQQ